MNEIGPLLAPLLLGLAVAGLVMAAWPAIHRRFQRDEEWLEQALQGVDAQASRARSFVTLWYGLMIVAPPAAALLLPGSLPAVAVFALILVTPRLIVAVLLDRRATAIEEQLPGAISSTASACQAGMTLAQAIEYVADHEQEPIRGEFRMISRQHSFGADLSAAIRAAQKRIEQENFDLFATALLTNQELGGDLSRALSRISASITSLKQMRKKIRAATSTGRTNIKVLAASPALILALLTILDAEAVGMLFTALTGQTILLISLVLTGSAVAWAWAIINTEI